MTIQDALGDGRTSDEDTRAFAGLAYERFAVRVRAICTGSR